MGDESQIAEQEESIVGSLYELARHIALITGAFLLIFGIAISMHWLIIGLLYIGLIENGSVLYWGLIGAKHVILLADMAILVYLIYKYSMRTARKI